MVQRIQISLSSPVLEHIPYTGASGIYSAMAVSEDSAEELVALAAELGFTVDPSKLHCTVMYSEVPLTEQAPAMLLGLTDVFASSMKLIRGHDNRLYIIVPVTSAELVIAHADLLNAGAVHTFNPYEPHVTLYKLDEGTEEEQYKAKVEELSRRLARHPLALVFDEQFISDLKDD